MKQPCLVLFFSIFALSVATDSARSQSLYQYDKNGNLANVAAAVPGPPTITAPPSPQSVYNGDDAAFSVVASGPGPMSYQWFRNATLIAGATNSTLFLSNVTAPSQNSYSVMVCNTYGCVSSTVPALLELNWTWVASGPADWFAPSSWEPAIVPSGFENIIIPAGAIVNLSAPVTLSGALTCYGGTISNNSLTIAPGGSLSVVGGTVNIQCQTFSYQGSLELVDNAVLNINGTWTNRGTITATNSSGGTVNLMGTLVNSNATLALNATSGSWVLNGGTVQGGTIAEISTNELFIKRGTLNGVIVNGGLNVGTYAGASLEVPNNLTINGPMLLGSSGTVVGGTIIMSNSASLVVGSGGGTLNGVTLDGLLDVGRSFSQAKLMVTNGLVLNGTACVGNSTNASYGSIGFAGSQTLGGNGTVVFGNSGYDALWLSRTGTVLTLGPALLVHGQNGFLGYSGSAWGAAQNVGIINRGTISADVSGGTLTVNAQPFSNVGVAQATNGGTLVLNGAWSNSGQLNLGTNSVLDLSGNLTGAALGTVNRSGGTINLSGTVNNAGNTLVLSGAWTLNGGTVRNGTVVTTNGASLMIGSSGGIFDGVAVHGTLEVYQNTLTVTNGLTLDGTCYVGNPTNSNWGGIVFAGSQMLGGNGTVVFGDYANPSRGYYNILELARAGTTLTNGPGITVRGQNGVIGSGSGTWWNGPSAVRVVNQGTISADVSGGTITINAQPLNNAGVAQAINGGTLVLNGAWSNSGQLNLGANSVLNLGGNPTPAVLSTVNRSGGTIDLSGTVDNTGNTMVLSGAWTLAGGTVRNGTVVATNAVPLIVGGQGGTLNGVTVDGLLDVGRSFSQARLAVTNGLVLNGTAYVGNPTNGSYGSISFAGSQTLGGNGTVVFGNSGYDALWLSQTGTVLTLGPAVLVHGQNGFLGYNGSAWGAAQNVGIINRGTISADVSGGTITINAHPFDNSGTVAATVGNVALAGTFNFAAGTLEFGLSKTNSFGRINISGSANLGGTVSAILLAGFVPAPLNSFPVLTYGSYTGGFTNTELPSTIVWETNYGPTTFTLSVWGEKPRIGPIQSPSDYDLASYAPAVPGARPLIKPILGPPAHFSLEFAGSTNNIYTVLASTNLALPFSNWDILGKASLLSNMLYQFIDTNSTKFPTRFYMLRSP